MRKIGAYFAIAAVAAAIASPSPAAAFGLRLGPFHIGLPFFGFRHHHRMVLPPAAAGLHDEVSFKGGQPAQGPAPALIYPALALPALYDDIFWPESSSPWPFGYEAIFRTAFATTRPAQDAAACAQADRATAIVERIRAEIRPNAAQLPLLQKLAGALGMASGSLAKSCPNEIPPQPVARLQLMQSQIEVLTMALDIIRPPLQQFEQSLDASQLARFKATISSSALAASACASTPGAVDWSIDQIDQSVQPSDAQRQALTEIKATFSSAARDLDAHCPTPSPPTPLARLEATQARLDAAWRAVLSIQVALADFETRLSDQQRARFDAMDLASAR